nr:ORF2 [Porcine astrovirus 4]
MANSQNNVQPKVVTTTTTTTSRRGRRRRRRATRASQNNTTTVRKVTTTRQSARTHRRRNNRPGNVGKSPPTGIRQRITATLGTVGANQGNEIETEMACLLSPALMRETTGSNQYGPLQIHASTYSLWRIENILLKLTPLVGPSAVSGTAVRASYNPSGQPGAPSWSALGARKKKDTNPGRPLTFFLSGREFRGPKDGWYFCNTKNDPQMCTAGTIEIHTLGQTVSTYTNEQFKGPLFLAEMTCTWSFKGYNPMPGMLTMVKAELKEEEQKVKIHSKPGEPVTISVPAGSHLARTTGVMETNVDASATPSDIIWLICDTTMDAVIGTLPVPFTWLFKAGWWFVKRIANKKKNGVTQPGEPDPGEVTYQVFQSMTDAMNDTPCIATNEAESANAKITGWNIIQVTPGSVGLPAASPSAARRMVGIDTTRPFYMARDRALIGESIITGLNFDGINARPLNGFAVQDVTSNRKVQSYNTYECFDPFFYQDEEIDPATADVPTYPMYQKTSQVFTEIGTVYATAGTTLGQPSTSSYVQWRIALWKATKTVTVRLQPTGSDRKTQFFYVQPSITTGNNLPNYTHKLIITEPRSFGQTDYTVTEGRWYITVFSALNGTLEFTNYGAQYHYPTSLSTDRSVSVDPVRETYWAGLAMMNAVPLKFTFNQPTDQTVTVSMVQQMVQRALAERETQDLSFPPIPPPSEYDNLEMPPLEGEEAEEPQGAVGGVEPSQDTRNWVEFGHRKRPPTPFSPIEEEEEDEEESDLDDDDYAEIPSYIKNLLTPEAKKLLDDLRKMGLSHDKAVRAAQGAYPHPAVEVWEAAYHNALVDGLSPPSARDCAWGAVSDYLP